MVKTHAIILIFGISFVNSNYFHCLMIVFILIGSPRKKWLTCMLNGVLSPFLWRFTEKKPFVCFESRKSSDFIDKAKTIHTIYTAGWPRQGVKPGHLCTYVLKPLNKQACEQWRKQSLIFHSLLKKKLVRQSA